MRLLIHQASSLLVLLSITFVISVAFCGCKPLDCNDTQIPGVTILQNEGLENPRSIILENGKIFCWDKWFWIYEAYDPEKRLFTYGGRGRPTASLQRNGTVIVNGNLTARLSQENQDICELLVKKEHLAVPRDHFRTVLLPNQKILVFGGCLYDVGAKNLVSKETPPCRTVDVTTAEIYDPLTDKSVKTGSMRAARVYGSASVLRNGNILLAGGSYPHDNTSELYDIQKGIFKDGPNLTSSRCWHTATLLSDGKILLVGGCSTNFGWVGKTDTDIYDPLKNAFIGGPRLQNNRLNHSATLLESGAVLIAGGSGVDQIQAENSAITSVEIVVPNSSGVILPNASVYKLRPLEIPRAYHSVRSVPYGKVLLFGGENHHPNLMQSNNRLLKSSELYEVSWSGRY